MTTPPKKFVNFGGSAVFDKNTAAIAAFEDGVDARPA
jgi:hypothetical protein